MGLVGFVSKLKEKRPIRNRHLNRPARSTISKFMIGRRNQALAPDLGVKFASYQRLISLDYAVQRCNKLRANAKAGNGVRIT